LTLVLHVIVASLFILVIVCFFPSPNMPRRKKTTSSKTPATRKAALNKSTTGKTQQPKKAPISVEFIESENEESVFIVDDSDEHEASEYDE
jgi:hypothetical protein